MVKLLILSFNDKTHTEYKIVQKMLFEAYVMNVDSNVHSTVQGWGLLKLRSLTSPRANLSILRMYMFNFGITFIFGWYPRSIAATTPVKHVHDIQ